MIYDIAGLRVKIENQYSYTDKFCQAYLSDDQRSPVDIVAQVTAEEFAAEKSISPQFSDGYIENICLYRSICNQMPSFGRILLHCSVIEHEGNAYAFLGKSGTGKSTHTKLWMKYLQGVNIVNGDKPILSYSDGVFTAHGTPWMGKEGWGANTSAPLKALCFLEQAKVNCIRKLALSEAPSRLFLQILIPHDEENAALTLELADKIVTKVPAYLLQCDISMEAVKTSFEAMTGNSFEEKKKLLD